MQANSAVNFDHLLDERRFTRRQWPASSATSAIFRADASLSYPRGRAKRSHDRRWL